MSERVVDKIQKLLNLANDSRGNEQERDTALRQAHALLVKHNLTLEMVDAKARENQDPRGIQPFVSWSMPWCRYVFNDVARLFFCFYTYGGKLNSTKMQHYYTGRVSNATTASLIGQYVVTSILAECRARFGENLSAQARAFGLGAAARIAARVTQLIAAQKQELEAVPGTALVLADLYASEETSNREYHKHTTGSEVLVSKHKDKEVEHLGAFTAGLKFGEKVSLNAQVGADEAPKALR